MLYHQIVIMMVAIISAVSADNALVTFTNPVNNQILIPNQQVIVQYTVNGVPGQSR